MWRGLMVFVFKALAQLPAISVSYNKGKLLQVRSGRVVFLLPQLGLFHFTYRASPQHILLHFPIHLLHFPNKFASFPQQIASFPQQIAAFPQQIAAFPQPVSHFPNAMLCHFAKN